MAQLGEQLEPADQLGIGLVRVSAVGPGRIGQPVGGGSARLAPRGLVGKSMLEAFLDHGVEQLVAEARRRRPRVG